MTIALLHAFIAFVLASPAMAQPETDKVNATATLETFLNREHPELDAIGDPLPRRAVMRFGTERFQHPSSVIAMELSPDEATLITLNSEAIIAWDTVTGAELWRRDWRDYGQHIIGPAYGQRFLTFATNSSRFFTPGNNNQVHAWSTRSGQVESVQLTDQAGILQLFGAPRIASFTSVDLSPDGDFLLAGNSVGVSQYTLQGKRQWNLENKPDVPLEFGGDNRDRLSFAGDYSTGIYSPDGKLVAIHRSQYPNRISLVSSESGKIFSGIATRDIVVRMTFSPDGSSLFTTERDCGIRRYSLQDQNLSWELVVPPDEKGAESYASAISCTADGKMLAVGMPIGPKDWIYLVDAETGEQRSILKSDMWKPWAVRFTQDGELLYSSGWDGAIRRWDVESAKELPLPKGIRATSSIAMAADGQRLAFVDGAGQVRVVDTDNGQQLWGFQPQHAQADRLQFAPDGHSIFVGGARDDTVAIESWSFDKQHMDSHWHWPVGEDPHSSLEALSITEDGKIVAGAVFRQHKAYVWEADTGKLLAELPHKSVYGLDVAADGKTLATVGWDRMLRFWEVPSGKLLKQVAVMDFFDKAALRNADRRMYGVCYSPNGKRIAIAHMDGEVSVWGAENPGEPQLLHTFPAFRSFSYGALDFSPDGLWLAAGDSGGNVSVFDSFAGDKVLDVGRHQDLVYTVQFGRDATQLVSGGRNIGFLWNLAGDTQSSSDESHAQLWQDLASSNTDNVWHAVVAGKDQESWTAYVMDRLMSIQTVMDPEAITRSLDDGAKQRRLELLQKAVEQDSSVEYSKTVHRALSVLLMSPSPKCDEFLKWCAARHPNKQVRTLAARLLD